jgi:hypothetical protein
VNFIVCLPSKVKENYFSAIIVIIDKKVKLTNRHTLIKNFWKKFIEEKKKLLILKHHLFFI